ncbi:MAG: hypothetical protein U9N52_09020 [Campylobacterota bacterium]|nr:hypothetical protein [Campylobacterota bacterium]
MEHLEKEFPIEKIMLKTFLLSLILVIFTACATRKPVVVTKPQWISAPYIDNEIAAVGSAHIHYKGKTAQRKLAISRALDELALQKGVKVKTFSARHDQKAGARVSAKSDIYSYQTSDNKTIHAHIKDTWSDPRTDELFIWMVAD